LIRVLLLMLRGCQFSDSDSSAADCITIDIEDMEASSRYLLLLSVYVPTGSVKANFTDDLQYALDTLPAGDTYCGGTR